MNNILLLINSYLSYGLYQLKEHVLHIAACKGHFDMMKWLLNHGAEINHQDHVRLGLFNIFK